MLPSGFIAVAIALRLIGGFAYLRATARGRAHPELISWFLWAATPMIAFSAELSAGIGSVALVTLALGVSPLLVFVTALIKRTGTLRFDLFNICCVVLSVTGVALWRLTSDPELAIVLVIMADIASVVPTIRKIIRAPHTEYPVTYGLSAVAMILTLLTITKWQFAAYAFPLYILAINIVIVSFIIYYSTKHRTKNSNKRGKRKR